MNFYNKESAGVTKDTEKNYNTEETEDTEEYQSALSHQSPLNIMIILYPQI